MRWKTNIVAEDSLLLYCIADDGKPDLTAVEIFPRVIISLRERFNNQILEAIPSYTSLLLVLDITSTSITEWNQRISILSTAGPPSAKVFHDASTLIEIPVYYAEQTGPDLQRLAEQKQLTPNELIELHTAVNYRVYALGFAPGFPYLGFVDERIAAPRLEKPRRFVQKGSVGIADNQTGIYPNMSPGGWNIIGRTPEPMLQKNPTGQTVTRLQVGDLVRFRAIDKHEFLACGGAL